MVPYMLSMLASLVEHGVLELSLGRVVVLIDFRSVKQMELVRIVGDCSGYNIVSYNDLGIPVPEGVKSGNCLVVRVAPGGKVTVMVQVPPIAYRDIVGYAAIYSLDIDVNVNMYWNLGGVGQGRNSLAKPATLPKGSWGRMFNSWFVEYHHGTVWIAIEISNPSSTSEARVAIGCIQVSSIRIENRGVYRLFGWEDTLSIELSNETFTQYVHVLLPFVAPNIKVSVELGVTPGTNSSVDITIKLLPSGKTLHSASGVTTSTQIYRRFSIYPKPSDPNTFETAVIEITVSVSGTATIDFMIVTIYGAEPEFESARRVSASASISSEYTLIDVSTEGRITYIDVTISNSGSYSVEVKGYRGGAAETIATVPPNSSTSIRSRCSYDRITLVPSGSTTVSVDGVVTVASGIIP